jgi:RNA polymerase-binding transcription factor DksA
LSLTAEQRQHLEGRLQEERERVLGILRRSDETRSVTESERSGDISNLPFHLADVGSESYEQEMDLALAQRASEELRVIDDALQRFYQAPDRYGICEETGEPIAFERLDLIPWARTCGERARA